MTATPTEKPPARASNTGPGQNETQHRQHTPAPTDGKPKVLTHHERFLPKAEDAARQLVASWIESGPKEINTFDPAKMPTGPLVEVATGVLDAMTNRRVRDFAGIAAYFTEAPEGVRGELQECSQTFSPRPQDCKPLLAILTEYDRTRRRETLAHRLIETYERGDDTAAILREIAEFEAEGTDRHTLREKAYALRFDPDKAPPPDETCMSIGEFPIAARGNLTATQGKSKVGKSAIISAILGAAQRGIYQTTGDTLCISWLTDSAGAIIHLDSEQSRADWHGLVCRSITRSGLGEVSPRLVSLPCVMFNRIERMEILRQTLAFEHERNGVDLVTIDGVADLCQSPNDEAEGLAVVSELMALAQRYNCAIVCVLHENPGTETAKTRGHLGSELNRKAFANLRVDKDAETLVSTIYGLDMRKRDIPKEQGFCFGWDDAISMHTFQGRAAGLKAAHREAEAIAKARAEWGEIFACASGTNGACPTLSVLTDSEAERDMGGTNKLTKPDTMRKRMQRAESLGVLRKVETGFWALNQVGQEWDK